MESVSSWMNPIDVFNIVMLIGLVGLSYAIHDIGKLNKILHAKNLRERASERCGQGDSKMADPI